MARFTINVAENIQADIYKGSITKKRLNPFKFWKRQFVKNDKSTGYVAIMKTAGSATEEYLLVKQQDGNWQLSETEPCLSIKRNGKWQPIADNNTTIEIKKAIDKYENNKAADYENK